MFFISGLARDKHVTEILKLLDGKLFNIEVRPVKQPDIAPGASTSPSERKTAALGQMPKRFTTTEFQAAYASLGGVPKAGLQALNKMAAEGAGVKRESRGHYVKTGRE